MHTHLSVMKKGKGVGSTPKSGDNSLFGGIGGCGPSLDDSLIDSLIGRWLDGLSLDACTVGSKSSGKSSLKTNEWS